MKRIAIIEYEIGDVVKLPLSETGKIVRIETERLDWFPYKIKIRKCNPLFFHKTNQIVEYKKEQLDEFNKMENWQSPVIVQVC